MENIAHFQIFRERKNAPPPSHQNYYDDASEEDSSMDDFIDDDDEQPNIDIQKEIRKLTKYDRRKYKNENDEDLRGMVADTGSILREEDISRKLGKREDKMEKGDVT